MRTLTSMASAAVLCCAAQAPASASPAGDQVKQVLDYYYAESGAPVLVDFKVCEDVHTEGVDKYNCKDEIDPRALVVGERVYAWMNFMVPREEHGEVLVQLKHNGVIRSTRKADVHGAIRYRTWRRIQLSRTGEWEIPILYENGETVEPIETVYLTVHEPMVSQLLPETAE